MRVVGVAAVTGRCETCGKATAVDCHLCGECAADWQTDEGRARINRRRASHGMPPLSRPEVLLAAEREHGEGVWARRQAVRVEARTLQAGDRLTTGGRVTRVEPGPGRTVHVYTDDAEGYAVEHMDDGVWIRSRDEEEVVRDAE